MTNSKVRRSASLVALMGLAACGDTTKEQPWSLDAAELPVQAGDAGADGSTEYEAGPLADAGALDASHDAAPRSDSAVDAAVSARDAQADANIVGTGGVLAATIVVKKGQSFDGGGKRYTAGPSLGDGSQSESQKPLFKLEDGASLSNVVIGAPAADGIHTYGNVQLANIVWEDIGEDALTIKESGTVVLRGGSARNGDDKVFQVNAASTFRVSDFTASDAGKFIRQNGGTTFKVEVVIERCDIARMKESIFRTDSSTSTIAMRSSRYSEIGEELFMGVTPANVLSENNQEY
jgi:pectate lyase C